MEQNLEKKELILDVGANHGEFCLEIAKRNPNIKVLSFEPEPTLARELQNNEQSLSNLVVFQKALADVDKEETRKFNVSHSGDGGTSSLLEFDKEHLKNNEYWNSRSDLLHDETIDVKVCSLASILDSIEFDEIAFIKIDSQGLDIDILKSMGKYFDKIKAGVIEVPATKNVSLYNNEVGTLTEALIFFKEHNYNVYQIKSNDEAGYEYNVYFHRKDVNIKDIEIQYNLKDLNMYDGKNYWFLPSNKPQLNIDINTIETLDRIENTLARIENTLYRKRCNIIVRLISCIIPNKKLRKKIRGEYC